MAQGAKPGEGGHLPGKKDYPWIAKPRLSRRELLANRFAPCTPLQLVSPTA